MLIISKHEQGSDEWFQDRCGKATGSNASAVNAEGKTKTTEAVTRRNYRFQLALERIIGKPAPSDFKNAHMDRGNELEKFARMSYETITGEMVEEAGFCWQENELSGCSVDGFVQNRKGIIEIKCPIPAIHYGYIQANELPSAYLTQVLHNIIVTKAEYCDFISYCEDMPEKLQTFIFRFVPTQEQLDEYQEKLDLFLDDVDLLTTEIQRKAA